MNTLDEAANLALKSNRSKIDLDVLTAIFTEKYPRIINILSKLIIARKKEKDNDLCPPEKHIFQKKPLPQIPFLLIILNEN